jgi:hypothetical protein
VRQKAPKIPKADDPITAEWARELVEFVIRNSIDVGQSSGLSMRQTPYGTALSVDTQTSYPYLCQPGTTVSGATGTWPTITPISFTADVYIVSGSVMTKIAPSATIFNWYAASLDANKTCTLMQDSSGSFVVLAQSCT